MWNNENEQKFIEIFEQQIKSGKNIYESHIVVAEQLNIPLHVVNSRYYTKIRKMISKDTLNIIENRKTERQREKYFTKDLKLEIDRLKQEIERLKLIKCN